MWQPLFHDGTAGVATLTQTAESNCGLSTNPRWEKKFSSYCPRSFTMVNGLKCKSGYGKTLLFGEVFPLTISGQLLTYSTRLRKASRSYRYLFRNPRLNPRLDLVPHLSKFVQGFFFRTDKGSRVFKVPMVMPSRTHQKGLGAVLLGMVTNGEKIAKG